MERTNLCIQTALDTGRWTVNGMRQFRGSLLGAPWYVWKVKKKEEEEEREKDEREKD